MNARGALRRFGIHSTTLSNPLWNMNDATAWDTGLWLDVYVDGNPVPFIGSAGVLQARFPDPWKPRKRASGQDSCPERSGFLSREFCSGRQDLKVIAAGLLPT